MTDLAPPESPVAQRAPTASRPVDPLTGVTVGLVLVVLGLVFWAELSNLIRAGDMWKWFLVGLGAAFLTEAALRASMPRHQNGLWSRLVAGAALSGVGMLFLLRMESDWPLVLIALGAILLVRALASMRE